MDEPRVGGLLDEVVRRRLNRRDLIRRAGALGLAMPALGGLLAACNGAAEPPATPEAEAEATPPAAQPGATPEPDEAATGGVINVMTTLGDKGISNPILTGGDYWTEWITFSKLFKYDDHGEILQDLAESFEYSDDGLELTLSLVQTNWHDGEPFSSADVIFTFDTVSNPDVDTALGSRLQVAGEFVQWQAPDDRTVVVTMPELFAPFLFALSQISIIPRHLLEGSADINTDPFNANPVGTGPFRFIEKVPDQYVRYERYDDYFKGRPAADGWIAFYMADTNAAAAALDRGEIDMMFTPPEMQERYERQADDFMVLKYVFFTPITLSFNHKHPILQDLNVRKAIAHAIDKESLNNTVTRGRGLLANNQYAETGPLDRFNDYVNVNYMEEYPFDLDRARALLDEAGYAPGAGGIRERDGMRMSFPLLTYAGFDEYQNGQVIIQEMLAQVGIEAIPQVLEYTTLEGLWRNPDDDPLQRAMELQEWPHPFEQDPDVFNSLHSTNHPPGDNYMWFADDEVDRLIDLGRTTVDLDEREQVYHQLDQRRLATLPSLPLYCAIDAWTVSRRVGGVPEDTPSIRWYHRAFPERFYKIES